MELNEIKKQIRAINPMFTDELLDLLHEYFCQRNNIDILHSLNSKKIKNITTLPLKESYK